MLTTFGEKPGTDSEDIFGCVSDFISQFKSTLSKMPVEDHDSAKKESVSFSF